MVKDWGLISRKSHGIQNGRLKMLGVINVINFFKKRVNGTISPRALQALWLYAKAVLKKLESEMKVHIQSSFDIENNLK
jgi:hypothetical protein